MKKKFLGLFLLLSVAFALSACGGSDTTSAEDDHCTQDPNAPDCAPDTDEGMDTDIML